MEGKGNQNDGICDATQAPFSSRGGGPRGVYDERQGFFSPVWIWTLSAHCGSVVDFSRSRDSVNNRAASLDYIHYLTEGRWAWFLLSI